MHATLTNLLNVPVMEIVYPFNIYVMVPQIVPMDMMKTLVCARQRKGPQLKKLAAF